MTKRRIPLLAAFFTLAVPGLGFAWGREGHTVVALIAERYMTSAAIASAGRLLGGARIDSVASWADDYRRYHRDTGPWHYIDIPLADSRIDMARECPQEDCVIGKTEYFLGVLSDPKADEASKVEALKFVVHFVGDMHQPLHDEDDGDKGGNAREVVFDGRSDNLHWLWDTGLLAQIDRNPRELATDLEGQITPRERARWDKGSLADWALEGHRLAQSIAYGDLGAGDSLAVTPRYERQADRAVETQLEKAGVRLAYLLNQRLPRIEPSGE